MSSELHGSEMVGLGLAWSGAAAISCLVAQGLARTADYLEYVTPFRRLGDLADRLNGVNIRVPLLVSVSGWVGSDTPIKCKHSDVWGVVVKKKKKQHFIERNDKGEWEEKEDEINTKFKAVPWYLDDGANRVYVTGARLYGLPLTFGSVVFKKPKQSLALAYEMKMEERGLKMLSVEKTEYVLPLNRYVTVVGEATKGRNGTIVIREPSKGQLLVTFGTFHDLIESKRSWSRFWESAAVVFGVAGVVSFATGVLLAICVYDDRQDLLKRVE